MASDTVHHPPASRATGQRGRRTLWLKRTVWLLLAAWLTWYGYTRWTTLPPGIAGARPTESAFALTPDEKAFVTALAMLPEFNGPRRTASAPVATSYPILSQYADYEPDDLHGLLLGEWDATSDRAQRLTSYLNRADVAPHLQTVDRLLPTMFEEFYDTGREILTWDLQLGSWQRERRVKHALALLTARARRAHAEQGALGTALTQLRHAIMLSEISHLIATKDPYRTPSLEVEYVNVPYMELMALVEEEALPLELSKPLMAFLVGDLGLSFFDQIRRNWVGDNSIDTLLDAYYTDDGSGDGWLVLSVTPLGSDGFTAQGGLTEAHSSVWNLMSFAFKGRAAMRRTLESHWDYYRTFDTVPYRQVRLPQSEYSYFGRPKRLIDGPLADVAIEIDGAALDRVASRVARRRGAVVMLGLSAYRHAHGRYPDSLDALVPDYLDSLPLDLYSAGRFRYVPDPDRQGYTLRVSHDFGAREWNGSIYRFERSIYQFERGLDSNEYYNFRR